MDPRTTQTYLSLASGIGGLDLGAHAGSGGGAVPICYVEIEASACGVLAARMAEGALPPAPIWSDLKTFDARGWRGAVDGIVAGYPCQPFSVAGRGGGFDDPRNLWPDIARIIAECRPRWCFFENVPGHLRRGYFTDVKPDLEALGFRVEEQVCKAAHVGAPHQRERLFILAVADSYGRNGGSEPRLEHQERPEISRRWGNGVRGQGAGKLANTDGVGRFADHGSGSGGAENRKQQDGERTPDAGALDSSDRMGRLAQPDGAARRGTGRGNADTSRRRIEANHTLHLHDQTNIWVEEAVGGDWAMPTQEQGGGYYGNGAEKLDRQAKNWPTVLTTDQSSHEYQRRPDGTIGETLAGAVKDWVTPNASEMIKSGASDAMAEKMLLGGQAVAWPEEREDWSTPSGLTGGQKSRSGKRKSELLLGGQATFWAEEANDQSSPQPVTIGTLGKKLREMGIRYRLNPQFAEWLMGLPPDWVSRDPNSFD